MGFSFQHSPLGGALLREPIWDGEVTFVVDDAPPYSIQLGDGFDPQHEHRGPFLRLHTLRLQLGCQGTLV